MPETLKEQLETNLAETKTVAEQLVGKIEESANFRPVRVAATWVFMTKYQWMRSSAIAFLQGMHYGGGITKEEYLELAKRVGGHPEKFIR